MHTRTCLSRLTSCTRADAMCRPAVLLLALDHGLVGLLLTRGPPAGCLWGPGWDMAPCVCECMGGWGGGCKMTGRREKRAATGSDDGGRVRAAGTGADTTLSCIDISCRSFNSAVHSHHMSMQAVAGPCALTGRPCTHAPTQRLRPVLSRSTYPLKLEAQQDATTRLAGTSNAPLLQ